MSIITIKKRFKYNLLYDYTMKKIGVVLIIVLIVSLLTLNFVLAEPKLLREGFTESSFFTKITGRQVGCVEWEKIDGAAYYDEGNSIAVDLTSAVSPDVFVTGKSWTASPSQGDDVWTKAYFQPSLSKKWFDKVHKTNTDTGYDLVLDSQKNTYVVFTVNDYTTKFNRAFIRKLNINGTLLWEREYTPSPITGITLFNQTVYSLTIDKYGYLYAAGYVNTNTRGKDLWLFKVDQNGSKVWSSDRFYNNALYNKDDAGRGLGYDPVRNLVYVAGYTTTTNQGRNLLITRYKTDGTPGLIRFYNGPANKDDEGNGVVANSYGVYVTGYTTTTNQGADIWTGKYNHVTMTNDWFRVYNGLLNHDDIGNDITTDSAGYLYVVGSTYDSNSQGSDIITLKYSSGGANGWASPKKHNGGPAGTWSDDKGAGISVDNTLEKAVYITGFILPGPLSSRDIFTKKYCQ